MKDSTIIVVVTSICIAIMYCFALSQGINGALFTIATNAIILIGTGKIIYDKGKNV